jgi:hypothetical protein
MGLAVFVIRVKHAAGDDSAAEDLEVRARCPPGLNPDMGFAGRKRTPLDFETIRLVE